MSILSKETPAGMGTEIHGPFLPEYFVTSNGYRVPYVTVRPRDDGKIDVFVDNRFGLHEPVSNEELDNWLPILAHAMAVAAGYSCHGENCRPKNPFKQQMTSLGSIPPKLTLIEGGEPIKCSQCDQPTFDGCHHPTCPARQ